MNCRVALTGTDEVIGLASTTGKPMIVTSAEFTLVESATDVAVNVTVAGDGIEAGAV